MKIESKSIQPWLNNEVKLVASQECSGYLLLNKPSWELHRLLSASDKHYVPSSQ